MNREEAIAILNHKVSACLHGTEWGEALDMAIKALSDFPYVKYTENGMEPDFEMANVFSNADQHISNALNDDGQRTNVLEDDAVSRRAVIDAMYELCGEGSLKDNPWRDNPHIDAIIDAIDDLPPVNSQEPKWIPVSERLPEEIGTYMTTIDYEKHGIAVGQRYYHGKVLGWEDDCVIAWMPLPKPYEPQESDHKCHTCKHYTSGEHDGSCGSYICSGYSNWEREDMKNDYIRTR